MFGRRLTIHRRTTVALQLVLAVSIGLSILEAQWLTAAVTLSILLLTLVPLLVGRRYPIFIPAEFEVLAIVFVFASLFLGEVRGYYTRFWWWDALLHVGSGLLLGVLGFLLVYVMNQKPLGDMNLRPGFIATFAFAFAVAIGALWEIFEFAMDQTFGLNMQKSGLVDTMWDMVVNTFGAAVIAVLGYGHLKTIEIDSFLERWIDRFLAGNAWTGAGGESDSERDIDLKAIGPEA
ncbi:MAG: hypothetical protein WD737_07350 [Gemmatimonadota bacterium]